jgi:hypothetical protein
VENLLEHGITESGGSTRFIDPLPNEFGTTEKALWVFTESQDQHLIQSIAYVPSLLESGNLLLFVIPITPRVLRDTEVYALDIRARLGTLRRLRSCWSTCSKSEGRKRGRRRTMTSAVWGRARQREPSSFLLITLHLEMSDTKVCEP